MKYLQSLYNKKEGGYKFTFNSDMVTAVTGDGKTYEGWVQDIVKAPSADNCTVTLVLLDKDEKNVHKLERTCEAKPGCNPNWDAVGCIWMEVIPNHGEDSHEEVASISDAVQAA